MPVPVPPEKNVLTGYDSAFEDSCEFVGDGANADQVFDPKLLCIELVDGERDAVQAQGGMTAAIWLLSSNRESRTGFPSEMSSPKRRAMILTATSSDLGLRVKSEIASTLPERSTKTCSPSAPPSS